MALTLEADPTPSRYHPETWARKEAELFFMLAQVDRLCNAVRPAGSQEVLQRAAFQRREKQRLALQPVRAKRRGRQAWCPYAGPSRGTEKPRLQWPAERKRLNPDDCS